MGLDRLTKFAFEHPGSMFGLIVGSCLVLSVVYFMGLAISISFPIYRYLSYGDFIRNSIITLPAILTYAFLCTLVIEGLTSLKRHEDFMVMPKIGKKSIAVYSISLIFLNTIHYLRFGYSSFERYPDLLFDNMVIVILFFTQWFLSRYKEHFVLIMVLMLFALCCAMSFVNGAIDGRKVLKQNDSIYIIVEGERRPVKLLEAYEKYLLYLREDLAGELCVLNIEHKITVCHRR